MLGNQPTAPTVIGRVRVRARTQDSLLTQMRIGRLLNPIELRPKQLPSSAILYIRTLRDPLPGALRLANGDVRPSPAWQEALNAALERLASRAVRPAREAVPPGAEAVVFIDRSELLACLASDWCEGNMSTRWWWQSLLKQGAAAQIVKELWRRDPQYVPAALQQLASKNKATDFVRTLSDSEAGELLRGVARSFALPALIRVLDDFETPANTDWNSFTPNQPKTAARQRGKPATATRAGPWRAWAPECRAAELRPEQEFFFGVALMLQRAPVKARAPEFHASVREWQQEVSSARAGKSVRTVSIVDQPATPNEKLRGSAILDEPLRHSSAEQSRASVRAVPQMNAAVSSPLSASQALIGADSAPPAGAVAEPVVDILKADQIARQPLHPEYADAELRPQAAQPTDVLADSSPALAKMQPATMAKTNGPARDSIQPTSYSQRPSSFFEASAAGSESSIVTDEAAPPTADDVPLSRYNETPPRFSETVIAEEAQTEEWIETGVGGVFYLINLGLALGLYGDFTSPDEPGIQLNIWDFVALLAHELAGDEVVNDPVWLLLQQLAQREEGDLLGSGFDPATVSSFEFQVLSSEPAVSDFESSFESSKNQTQESDEARNAKLKTEHSKLKTSPAVVAWLDRLMPNVRARLRLALGLSEADDPGPLVCRQRARVCLTPTHLDVFFFLTELPIEIRIAGLDRDPGWVPAAGRFIAFHFD